MKPRPSSWEDPPEEWEDEEPEDPPEEESTDAPTNSPLLQEENGV